MDSDVTLFKHKKNKFPVIMVLFVVNVRMLFVLHLTGCCVRVRSKEGPPIFVVTTLCYLDSIIECV